MRIEERRWVAGDLEIRAAADRNLLVGYAAKFGVRSQNLGGFVEKIAPKAFNRTLSHGGDVVAVRDHDQSRLLGRLSAGTLRLELDDVGLRYEVDLPDTTEGRDTAELLARGDLIGSSFKFRPVADEWDETESGYPERTLTEVELFDVGPVTFPAYPDAEASLRSLADARSLDLADLVSAAAQDDLRSLILPTVDQVQPAVEAPVPVFHRSWRR